MGDKTSIEWADATWNPVAGCSKVSPGCAHCYAEAVTARYAGRRGWIDEHRPWTPANAGHNVLLRPHKLEEPLRWGKPRRIFVNSMSDLFHEQIPDDFIARVFAVMADTQRHTFQVLTKRPERAKKLLGGAWIQNEIDEWTTSSGTPWPLPNVWLGTSIENRQFVHRADLLRETPAAVRFISAEPLLGPLLRERQRDGYLIRERRGRLYRVPVSQRTWADGKTVPELDLTGIDQLIVGGESGRGARPMNLEWARALLAATRCPACGGTGWICSATGLPVGLPCDVAGCDGPCPSSDGCAACHATGFTTAFFLKQIGGARAGSRLEALPEDLQVREWPRARGGSDA